MKDLVIFRGGGDVATGGIQKVFRTGFKTLVLEKDQPLCVRRYVSAAQAMIDGQIQIEDFKAVKVKNPGEIERAREEGLLPVISDQDGLYIERLQPLAVVDGILAKRNTGTRRGMAPITIGLGPGFEAGKDVDVVIETNRGHDCGRLIFGGRAQENTGVPGNIMGYTIERILRSPADGRIEVLYDIGSFVKKDQVLAKVSGKEVKSQLDGMVRGMIGNGTPVKEGMKVGDVDPRTERKNTGTISDKSRLIGGGVLEAILIMKRRLENADGNS